MECIRSRNKSSHYERGLTKKKKSHGFMKNREFGLDDALVFPVGSCHRGRSGLRPVSVHSPGSPPVCIARGDVRTQAVLDASPIPLPALFCYS